MTREQIDRFIQRLIELRDDEKNGRATMATLRRALSGEETDTLPVWKYLRYSLPSSYRQQDDCVLIAALFATHQGVNESAKDNLGTHLAKLRARKEFRRESADSLERRFSALIAAEREDLPYHLRAAVSFLKDEEIPINWARLLTDVLYWDSESRHPNQPTVQRHWADAFWRSVQAEEPSVNP
jgi:CRISPR system Cascade subunit CasB